MKSPKTGLQHMKTVACLAKFNIGSSANATVADKKAQA